MRLMHLSDLHIGKRVNEYSMLEDQKYILDRILKKIEESSVDAVIIAGDVYDKSLPPTEAVQIFDDFLVKLSRKNPDVFVISGNHDSPERIAFGGRLMSKSGIYISPVYSKEIEAVVLGDSYGEVNIYMLPFIKPAHVRALYPEREIPSYTDAVRVAIDEMHIDTSKRNILISHQFVSGAGRTESEDVSVGGIDSVDVSVFEDFDYVALGHIHRAQNCRHDRIRYSGTPLKYSFSEAKDIKSITLVDIKDKGNISIEEIELKPLRDMIEIRGKYNEIMARNYYENTSYSDDYTHITLTDEEDVPDAIGKLRTVYHNLMSLDYDNLRTRSCAELDEQLDAEGKLPLELFADFFRSLNGREMSEEETAFMKKMIEDVWEDADEA